MRNYSLALGLLTSAACLIPAAASAQPSAAAPASSTVGELVVTAQRRTERFVDAPLSVSVVTANQLEASGVNGTRDLTLVTPGLNITMFGPYIQPTIRGVGTTVLGVGADSNVATYVDGVYQASQVAALFEFNNIERIETLKGPQGSLYGRNATGGAIVVTTREPSLTDRSATAEFSYGRYNELGASGYANLPLSDKLAVNLAIYNRANHGYTTNAFNKQRSSITESFGVRGRILFQPTDDLRFILTGAHIYQADSTALSYSPLNGNTPARTSLAATFGRSDHSQISQNVQPISKIDYNAVSLNGEWTGKWGVLTSITSWTHSDTPFQADQDGTEAPILAAFIPTQAQKTLTQEFTFASQKQDRFSWIGGLFFLQDRNHADFFVCALLPTGVFCPTVAYPFTPSVSQNTDAWAAYAEGQYDLSDRLHLTVGGRYSKEKKHAQYRNGAGGFLMLDGKASWDSFTPRAALRYDLTDVSSTYISYSKGFKSGLFDALSTGACVRAAPGPTCPRVGPPVNPEKVQAYELGYKYNSHGVSFSAAAFYNDYSDIQMTGRDAIGNLVLFNAAAGEIYGVEAELNAVLNENWAVRGGLTYTHAKYTDFPSAQDWTPAPTGGNAQIVVNATGNRMIRTPEYTAFASVDYHRPLPVGAFESSLSVSYSSSYFWDPSNRLQQPSFTIVNGRVSWVSPSERVRLSLFGDNLTNKERQLYVRSSNTGDLVSYSKPRSWGVSAGFKF